MKASQNSPPSADVHVAEVHGLDLDAPAISGIRGDHERHAVLIVGQDRVHVDPDGVPGDVVQLAEEDLRTFVGPG